MVLLHGLWMRGWAMTLLAQRLRGCGFTVVHYSYLSLGRTVSENATSLNTLLTSLNAPTVHLVGHSLGGLVILRLLQDYPTQQAGRVVLLGTPYAGSYVARTVAGHAATRWMLGKSFDGGLQGNGPQWAGGRELGVIAGSRSLGLGWLAPGLPRPNDGTVAVMETHVPGASGQIVLPVSHTGILFSAPVAGAVCDFLQNGRFKGTSKNPLKPRWRRWKCAQNAHVLRVHCAFSHLSALPSRLDRIFRGTLNRDPHG